MTETRGKVWLRFYLPFVAIMGCLSASTTGAAGYTCWYESHACPAKSTITYGKGGEDGYWMIINLGIIPLGYILTFCQFVGQPHNPNALRLSLFFSVPLSIIPRRRSSTERICKLLSWALALIWNILSSGLFAILQLLAWYI